MSGGSKTRDEAGAGDSHNLTMTAPGSDADERAVVERESGIDPDAQGPDRYCFVREHGRGGIGRVVRARDAQLGREVAVKELLNADPAAEVRFLREAAITARLAHPGIVPVYELGRSAEGTPYYSMKLIEGRTLKELVAEADGLNGRLALLPNVVAVARAVAYAHANGVIHRDLKPSNIVVGDYGETVVIDWGLAKDLIAEVEDAESATVGTESPVADLTVAGAVLGTPAYMAPEQARSGEVDERADVYALGAVLYQLVTGRPPRTGDASPDIIDEVVAQPVEPVAQREPTAPRELAAIIERAMAVEPAARYDDAGELADDLVRFQTGRLVSALDYTRPMLVKRWLRRHWLATAVAIAVVAVCVVAFLQVVQQRDATVAERDAKESARAETAQALTKAEQALAREQAQTVTLLEQQGRAEMSLGRPFRAARLFNEARKYEPDRFAAKLGLGLAMREVDSLQLVLRGHDTKWGKIIYNPDGTTLLTAARDGYLRIWDAQTGELRRVLTTGTSTSMWTPIDVSGDSKLVAFPNGNSTVRVATLAGNTEVQTVSAGGEEVRGLDFSPSGREILLATESEIRIVDIRSGKLMRQLVGEDPIAVTSAIYSPDGEYVAAGSVEGKVRVWDAATGRMKRLMEGQPIAISALAYSPSGHILAVASEDSSITLWDVAADKRLATLLGHQDLVSGVEFSPDGRLIVSTSWDNTMKVWDVDSKSLVRTVNASDGAITAVAAAPDGRHFATIGNDETARIWTAQVAGQLPVHDVETRAAFADAGGRLVTADRSSLRVWDVATTELLYRFPLRTDEYPWAIAYRAGGTMIAIGSYNGSVGRVYRLDAGPTAVELVGHETDSVFAVAISPDARIVATGGHDGTIRFWDPDTGARDGMPIRLVGVDGVPERVTSVAFSPDGRRLLATTMRSMIAVVDVSSRERLFLLGDTSHKAVNSAVYSADGQRILSLGWDDHTARLWDARTGELLLILAGHTSRLFSGGFSADGTVVVTSEVRGRALFWDAQTGAVLYELEGPAYASEFSPDGEHIVFSGGMTGDAYIVRLESRSPEEIDAMLDDKSDWDYVDGQLVRRKLAGSTAE